MLTFQQFITEEASRSQITDVIARHPHKPASAGGQYAVQFILPDGTGVLLSQDDVHARAAHNAALAAGLDFRLIDVMRAGIVRVASQKTFQVAARITEAQAQFMVDRATYAHSSWMVVSIADGAMADRELERQFQSATTDVGRRVMRGPTEIDDITSKQWDTENVKPDNVRSWVNANVA